MPVISRFYGIIIRMYFLQSEHNPPHIHVIYNGSAAAVDYMTEEILEGNLPAGVFGLVKKWIGLHREEIDLIWKTQEFRKIPPLI